VGPFHRSAQFARLWAGASRRLSVGHSPTGWRLRERAEAIWLRGLRGRGEGESVGSPCWKQISEHNGLEPLVIDLGNGSKSPFGDRGAANCGGHGQDL
jgi:hypothetical protein